MKHDFTFYVRLEDTARYEGLLLAPAERFGILPRLFFGGKKESLLLVTLVTFSSNLGSFERNPEKPKKMQKKVQSFFF